MGLTDGLTAAEAALVMLWYALPLALFGVLVVMIWRWATRPDGAFVATEPDEDDGQEHRGPPQ